MNMVLVYEEGWLRTLVYFLVVFPAHLLHCVVWMRAPMGSLTFPHPGTHTGINHSGINHTRINHSGINHTGINHTGINHTGINHTGMTH